MNSTINKDKLNNAMNVVKTRIDELRTFISITPDGDERETAKAEITALMKTIGLDNVGTNIVPPTTDTPASEGVGAAMLSNIQAATEKAAKLTAEAAATNGASDAAKIDVTVTDQDGVKTTTHTDIKIEQPGLWTRFKVWCGENKKKAVAGALTVLAGAAGLWYWLSGKNTNVTVSSVSHLDTVTIEGPVETPAADPSIFTRIGDWIVGVAGAVKAGTLSAWNWVTGLFTRTNSENVIVETPVNEPATVVA